MEQRRRQYARTEFPQPSRPRSPPAPTARDHLRPGNGVHGHAADVERYIYPAKYGVNSDRHTEAQELGRARCSALRYRSTTTSIAEVDDFVAGRRYATPEAFAICCAGGLEQRYRDGNRGSIATLSYVYDHATRELPNRRPRISHRVPIAQATLHVHIDHDGCLEVTVLLGRGADVRAFADHVIAERGRASRPCRHDAVDRTRRTLTRWRRQGDKSRCARRRNNKATGFVGRDIARMPGPPSLQLLPNGGHTALCPPYRFCTSARNDGSDNRDRLTDSPQKRPRPALDNTWRIARARGASLEDEEQNHEAWHVSIEPPGRSWQIIDRMFTSIHTRIE